jgi:hypothetical protein
MPGLYPQEGKIMNQYDPAECAAQGHAPSDHIDPADVRQAHTCVQGPFCAVAMHDCPREAFLDDPITVAYGVGAEMVHLVSCAVCGPPDDDTGLCPHESCAAIMYAPCAACDAPPSLTPEQRQLLHDAVDSDTVSAEDKADAHAIIDGPPSDGQDELIDYHFGFGHPAFE